MLKLLPRGADKHVSHEQCMVRSGADDAHVDSITFVPTGKAIDNIDPISGVEIVDRTLSVDSPDLSGRFRVSVKTSIPHPGRSHVTLTKFPKMRGSGSEGTNEPRCKGSTTPLRLMTMPAVQHSNSASFLGKEQRFPTDEAGRRRVTYIGRHRLVHGTPPNILVRTLLFHDAFVEG